MTFLSKGSGSVAAIRLLAVRPRIPTISPLVVTLAAILMVLIVPPAIFLLRVSLHETLPDGSLGAFTLRFYAELFSGRFFLS